MRSIWKGTISFGLVQIPVDLHGAEETDEIAFRQLDKHDFSPIGYERINKRTGKKVAWEDIVRGYEWDKGEYVVLTDDEIDSANAKATHTIDLVAFVDSSEIDIMYFDRPYYLTPSKAGTKAYELLRRTLERTEQVGIAKIVIRTRQHMAALLPKDDALMLVTMRYASELRDVAIPKASAPITDAEQKMADILVKQMHAKWKPDDYKDDFKDDVLALVEKKAKAGKINTVAEERHDAPRPVAKGNVLDLMEQLKKSIASKPRKSA